MPREQCVGVGHEKLLGCPQTPSTQPFDHGELVSADAAQCGAVRSKAESVGKEVRQFDACLTAGRDRDRVQCRHCLECGVELFTVCQTSAVDDLSGQTVSDEPAIEGRDVRGALQLDDVEPTVHVTLCKPHRRAVQVDHHDCSGHSAPSNSVSTSRSRSISSLVL